MGLKWEGVKLVFEWLIMGRAPVFLPSTKCSSVSSYPKEENRVIESDRQ